MERRLIDEIIALENSLKERIEEERRKAGDWLEGEKRRLDACARADEECSAREVLRALDAARCNAEAKREVVLAEAWRLAARMRAIPDDELRAIVARHVGKVLG